MKIPYEWLQMIGLAIPALIAVAVVAYCGWLRPETFRDAPERHTGLAFWDLFVALGIMLVGGVVMNLVGRAGAVPLPQGEGGLTEMPPGQVAQLALVVQSLTQGTVVLYILARVSFAGGGALTSFGLNLQHPFKMLWMAGAALVLVFCLAPFLTHVASVIGEQFGYERPTIAHGLLRVIHDATWGWPLISLLFSAVIVAPVLEEVIFRGLCQSALLETAGYERRWVAILVATLLFAIGHPINWQAMPALIVLSITLGWLYERTGSLWPNIFLHAAFNAVNVLIARMMTLPESGNGSGVV